MNRATSSWVNQLLWPSRGVVLAVAGFSLSVSVFVRNGIAPMLVAALILASPWWGTLRKPATPRFIVLTALVITILAVPSGAMSLATPRLANTPELVPVFQSVSRAVAAAGTAITAYAAWRILRRGHLAAWGWGFMLAWIVGAGTVAILLDTVPWIDVWHLHRDAGEALIGGASPYMGRGVPNPMPWFPEGSVFDGYVYPPVVLYTYAAADALAFDSRWVTLLAGFVLWITLRKRCRDATSESLAVLLLMVPGWVAMVQLSWTEPLSVALLSAAVIVNLPAARGLLWGLFIGSKQYLMLWAVPATQSWIRRSRPVLVAAGLTAAVAYGVGLLYGVEGYIRSAFVFHLTAPEADYGSGLPGIARLLFDYPLSIPGWLSLTLGVLVGIAVVARGPKTDATLLLAGVAMTFVVFMTGSQAFPNYWYLILGGLVLVILQYRTESSETEETSDAGADEHERIQ